ncbi:hypothetical protein [Rhizobium sp. RU36D]|uniref:hypothetical protein n=1 Tax=Rhizobium sp. RU36D TaxID=1907415 RepID=UPI000A02E3CE|nr:hypothetical protein [Rhizobium sp. RU36D]
MAVSILLSLALEQRLSQAGLPLLLGLYFAGGLLSWVVALPLARFMGLGSPVETRFAVALLLLTLGSAASTAFLFALQYRMFYAQWHQPFGTTIWMFQFVFTSASAVYQFGVLGLRLLMPFGFLLLLVASIILTRLIR